MLSPPCKTYHNLVREKNWSNNKNSHQHIKSDWLPHPWPETKTLNDAQSYGGTGTSSDHRLVVARMEITWSRPYHQRIPGSHQQKFITKHITQSKESDLQQINNTRNKLQFTSRNHKYEQMVHNQKNTMESHIGHKKKKLQTYKWSRNRNNVKITKRPKSSDREKWEPWSDKTIKQLRKSRKKTPKQWVTKSKTQKRNLHKT